MQLRFSKPFFRKRIKDKIKMLSIRKVWSNGGGIPEVGETLKLKDGNRWIKSGMPGCLKPILVDGKNPKCTGVWPVEIAKCPGTDLIRVETDFLEFLGGIKIAYHWDGNKESCDILEKFAIMDGWNNFSEMIEFFKLPLKANIIWWGEVRKLRYIEKYEISFERFANHKCDIMDCENDGGLWICSLEENISNQEENCTAYDCPLSYPAESKLDGDIDTVIVYRELV
jgi:hypothetical protein